MHVYTFYIYIYIKYYIYIYKNTCAGDSAMPGKDNATYNQGLAFGIGQSIRAICTFVSGELDEEDTITTG